MIGIGKLQRELMFAMMKNVPVAGLSAAQIVTKVLHGPRRSQLVAVSHGPKRVQCALEGLERRGHVTRSGDDIDCRWQRTSAKN